MARNKIEYHIPAGSFHTFKVAPTKTLYIGQPVVITGDMEVDLAGAGEKALGIVYSGTVGVDGINSGYKGDDGDVVTVVCLKPLVYLTAGGTVTAGDLVEVDGNGDFVTVTSGEPVAVACSGATSSNQFIAALL